MGTIANIGDRWLGRAASLYGLWPLLPAGVVVIVTQKLASTAEYLSALGPFGWWMIALVAGLGTYLAIGGGGLWAETRKLKRTQREIAKDARSPDLINPLASRYFQQRISLPQISDPFGRPLDGKEFDACQLMGPATVVVLCDYARNSHRNVEFVKIADHRLHALPNKIILQGGTIRNCSVANVLFLVPESEVEKFTQGFEGEIPWIN